MSASREKKNRQIDQPMTERQRQIEAKLASDKRKHTAYTVLGVAAAVGVAALLIWDSGIFQRNATALTVGDVDYTVTDVDYYYYPSLRTYQQMGLPIDEETKTILKEQAVTNIHQQAALYAQAQKDGFTLPQEDLDGIAQALTQMEAQAANSNLPTKSYIRTIYGPYMTMEKLEECLTRQQTASSYYAAHSDSLTYGDDQVQTYYDEHPAELDTFVYSAAFINGSPAVTDAQGNPVEPSDAEKSSAMSQAKAVADKLAADVKTGDFHALATAATEQDSSSRVIADASAAGSALAGSLSEECKTWLADSARTAGDITVVESPNRGYWVLRFQDRYLDEASYGSVDVRHILVKAEVADGATAPTEEALAAAKATAEDLLHQWESGEKTPESFGALATQFSEDPGSKDNGGLYTAVPRNQFFPEFNNWMFDPARKPGDTTVLENPQSGQQGWHVIYLEKQNELQWQFTARTALHNDEMNAWMEELTTTYALTEASGLSSVG